ncbi:MAG: ABC transporter ATP-binding protein [Anaerolineales bacterium]|nr:MAG: ABC transporter ATP-binding protein [Anaerolineales bacterium]
MIITQDLGKRFDDFWAVDGISIHVKAGEVLALLGPNGAGKTTTVRILTSVLRPTRGEARVAGFDVLKDADKVRASVGILTEQHGLYGRMPAIDYLDFFGQVYGISPEKRLRRIHHLLDQFGLLTEGHRRVGEFSKGMSQKLALARALLHNPPVLLLDEPTSAMDPESARLVRNSIQDLRSASRAVVICTHNLAEAEELADQIAIIRQGRIIAKGSPNSLKASLLGSPEYEVKFGSSLNGCDPILPSFITLTGRGSDWIRYKTSQQPEVNTVILRALLEQDLPVVGLVEVPRSLEQVYLQAISASNKEGDI